MYGKLGTVGLPMAGKMPSHSGTHMFYVKKMMLKSIQYSVFDLPSLLYVVNITFQAIYKLIALTFLAFWCKRNDLCHIS